jgi:hypothetical protein
MSKVIALLDMASRFAPAHRPEPRVINSTASEVVDDSLDLDAAHIKRLEQIAIRAEELAAEKRQEAKHATEEAAVRRRDYDEARAEFSERLKKEGLLP